jgi:hypothetical protein
MISFKVFDNNIVSSNQTIIDYINSRDDVFLEYTYYNKNMNDIMENRRLFENKQSSFHINSKVGNFSDFSKEDIEYELHIGRLLGSKKFIFHPEKHDAPKKTQYQANLLGDYFEKLIELSSMLKNDEKIYIENVRFEIEFYKSFFKLIHINGIKNIGFCFDIGHAKVFSGYNFEKWYQFLLFLDGKEIDIYFHVHANEGSYDEHKPYHSYHDIGVLNDDYFSDNIHRDLSKMFHHFKNKWFSLELMPTDVIKEIEFFESNHIYVK